MKNVVSLDDLFHKRAFQVPDYQRGYSWEERQVLEFLEDLELLRPQRHHYTGTIVLHEPASAPRRMDEDGKDHKTVAVVDGQQRLTTIVLLLDGICRELVSRSDSAKSLAHGIKKNFIAATEQNKRPLFKLSLNSDTDHYFKTNILTDHPSVEGPQITSERRLNAAKSLIASYLSNNAVRTEQQAEAWLQDLYTKLVTRLCFTLYEVDDEAEVGVIFEVMNDRGKPLTELEKVKNFLLHISTSIDVKNELASSINKAWTEILRRLMAADLVNSDDEDRLLRAHWLTHYNPQAKRWNGSRSIKEKFALKRHEGHHNDLLADLHVYADGLREACVSFCDAQKPNRSEAFESFREVQALRIQVLEWSEKLNRIGVLAPFLPLVLAARMRWPNNPKKYLRLLKLCECFAFRVYRLEGHNSNAGQSALFHLGHGLAVQNRVFSRAISTIKGELASRCDNRKFANALTGDKPSSDPSEWYTWGGLKYFLYEYELSLAAAQGASPMVTWEEVYRGELQNTIEHILPQSIDDQAYWQDRFTERKHKKYVHDLGNLTLTKHNSHLGNRAFPEKTGSVDSERHCYATSPLYVERELMQWKEWNASAIDDRRSRLLGWARERWAVDLSEFENDEGEDWDEGD